MIRPESWLLSRLFYATAGTLACTGTEPSLPPELPHLVYTEQDAVSGLWSIRGYTDGEGSREIAPGPADLPRPVNDFLLVRPTTGELLYVSGGPDLQYYVLLNPATGTFHQPELPGSVVNWSPKGDLLSTDFDGEQLVITVDGEIRATVCGPPVDVCGAPRWTPAGDGIVSWRRETGGQPDIWLVPLDGGAEVNLTGTADRDERGPSYSPDGQQLVYMRFPQELVLSNSDGSDPRVLISPVTLGNFPWSPDGLSVAVEALVDGQYRLVRITPAGDLRVLTPPSEILVPSIPFSWSPDGGRIAYTAFEGPTDSPGAFVINVNGSNRRQLSTPGNTAYRPTWMLGPALTP